MSAAVHHSTTCNIYEKLEALTSLGVLRCDHCCKHPRYLLGGSRYGNGSDVFCCRRTYFEAAYDIGKSVVNAAKTAGNIAEQAASGGANIAENVASGAANVAKEAANGAAKVTEEIPADAALAGDVVVPAGILPFCH